MDKTLVDSPKKVNESDGNVNFIESMGSSSIFTITTIEPTNTYKKLLA